MSEQDISRAVAMRQDGATTLEIAAAVHYGRAYVSTMLCRTGCRKNKGFSRYLRAEQMREQGVSWTRIADALGFRSFDSARASVVYYRKQQGEAS